MLKYAFLTLALVVGGLVALALLPKSQRAVPDSTIALSDASVTLFPQADPEAVWHFASPEVDYNPDARETVLHDVEDAERTVGSATDFTLQAQEVTIDSDDNLRGEQIFVHLIEEAWDLDMQARDNRLVLINQQQGLFEVPHLSWVGDGGEGINENMNISFDLTTFDSGGLGTVGKSVFDIGNADGE
ncbi:hypothetical protein BH24DEI2_BH24DEI2_02990 [soil metagenome]